MTTTNGNNVGSVQLSTVYQTDIEPTGIAATTFLRPKAVTFIASGLKPNTRYYPFFNDVYVGKYCTLASAVVNNVIGDLSSSGAVVNETYTVLKTDVYGTLYGVFYIPALTFITGSYVFKLVDKYNNTTNTPDPIYGSAEAVYEAKSILSLQQTQATSVTLNEPAITTNDTIATGEIVLPSTTQLKTFYFEYEISNNEEKFFTLTTNSPLPPNIEGVTPNVGDGNLIDGSVVFVSTTVGGNNAYYHKYRYQTTNQTKRYRQEWIGVNPADAIPDTKTFRPSGLLPNQTVTIIDISAPWKEAGILSTFNPVYGKKVPNRSDALAQSFTVDPRTYPKGLFVTSIGVYFKTADQSTPVILELRDMSNGIPGSNVLPGGTSLVRGRTAASSIDASVSTVFRFDTPVYLQPSGNYCFVLKSSSLGYNAWCSRVGDADVTTGKIIDTQPFNGVLFKSENNITWVPDSYEDIKFDLFKADFTSSDGEVYFDVHANADGDFYSTSQILPLSYISTVKDSGVITLKLSNHRLIDNENIKIKDVQLDINEISKDDLNDVHQISLVDDNHIKFTIAGSSANKTGFVAVNERDAITTPDIVICPPIPVLYPSDATSYIDPSTFGSSVIHTVNSVTEFSEMGVDSPNTFKVYTNINVDEVLVDYLKTKLDGTSIDETLVDLANIDRVAADDLLITSGEFNRLDEPELILSKENFTDFKTQLKLELKSSNKDLSPVVDVNGISLITKSYVINNQVDELDSLLSYNDPANSELTSGAGKATAKYKSPTITLDKAYNQMTIFVTGNCPTPAKFDVYIRTSTNIATHMDRPWKWVSSTVKGVSGSTDFEQSTSPINLDEWMFEHTSHDTFVIGNISNVNTSSGVVLCSNTTGLEEGQEVVVTGNNSRLASGIYKISVVVEDVSFTLVKVNDTPITTTTGSVSDLRFEVTELDPGKPFTVFDVKIVMRSTNTSIVPKIFGVRSIANNI